MLGVTGTAAITGLALSGLEGERVLFSIPVALFIGLFFSFIFLSIEKRRINKKGK